MNENCLYFDITRRERDSAIRYLLGAILNSRREDAYYSQREFCDEDVNVYLAHLLFAVSLPEYHDMAEPYLSRDSNEVMRWINEAEDQTIRYFIFKVNADHILIHTAIFNDMTGKGKHSFFGHSRNYFRELAKLYYGQASSYHKRIYRKKTGVGDVLDKMAYDFESYQRLLKDVRRKYFHFVNNFRDQAFHGFMRQMTQYEKGVLKKERMDEFLDVYGRWLNSKDPAFEDTLLRLVTELKSLDSEFNCPVVENFRREGGHGDEKKCA